ncbi:MAG: GNAT family N-acetyltransferase [Acidiferrobacter sp.]
MLRRATVRDLEGLIALESRCFGENEGVFNRRQMRQLLHNPRALWLIEGDYAGACCLLTAANGHARWGRLYSLSVDPNHRQQGIARRLLDGGLSWLADQGLTLCRAEVRADNAAARRLYANAGFVEVGELPHYYGIHVTGVRLVKRLNSEAQG